jgi:hypothetical protein
LWIFKYLCDFGLDPAAQGAASRREVYLRKTGRRGEGVQSLPYFSRAFFLL